MVQSNVLAENIVIPIVSEAVGKDAPAEMIEEVANSEVTPADVVPSKAIVEESEVAKEPVGEDAVEAVTKATVSTDAEVETKTDDAKVKLKAKATDDEVVATNEVSSDAHQEPEGFSEDMISKEAKRPREDDETDESPKKIKSDI